MATKTTKKSKPKCTKGTACGYSCIASGKVCNQPVPKEATAENLDAIPAKGKGGSKKAAQSDKVKVKVKYLYTGDEKNPKLTDGQNQLGRDADETDSYKTPAQIDNIVRRNKERGVDIKVGEKVVEVDKKDLDGFKEAFGAEEVEEPKTKAKATKTPKAAEKKPEQPKGEAKPQVDDKAAQSAFKELRREQETTGTGIVAVSADQLKAKLKSKAKISDKEADNVYEDLKKRKKIFTVKEKDRELIYWND